MRFTGACEFLHKLQLMRISGKKEAERRGRPITSTANGELHVVSDPLEAAGNLLTTRDAYRLYFSLSMTAITGVTAEPDRTLLTSRALEYLAAGPADVVDLIGHICNLPGAPRLVAEHMARAMFAGRREFTCDDVGRWRIAEQTRAAYEGSRTDAASAETLRSQSYVVVDVETTGARPYA